MSHDSPAALQQQRTAQIRWQRGFGDLCDGLKAWHVWWLLGWQDIRQRYRRSVLGPFWLTISTGIMVSAIGFLYSKIFGQPIEKYLPYLAIGIVVWNFLSSTINESCVAFVGAGQVIKQVKLPLTVHVVRTVVRNVITFAHNAIILVLIQVIFQKGSLLSWLYVVPFVFLVTLNMIWVGTLLAIFCTRFRDIPLIITNIIQIAFFLTPILWYVEHLGNRIWFAYINPFFHLIEIIRAPLLGSAIPTSSVLVVTGMLFIGFPVALVAMIRFRARVPYWL